MFYARLWLLYYLELAGYHIDVAAASSILALPSERISIGPRPGALMAVGDLLAILVLQGGTIFSPTVCYWLLGLLFGLPRLLGFLWLAATDLGASALGLGRFPVFAFWPGVCAFAAACDQCAVLVRQVNAVFSEGQVIRLYRFLIECSLRVDDFFATTLGVVRFPGERIIKWP